MQQDHQYFVYILSNKSRKLYIGVTNGLFFRVEQHRNGVHDGFTKKYKIHRLVYFERFQYINNAIAREKQLKGWLRERKVALIEEQNPTWEDIYPLMLRGEWKEKQILHYVQDDNVKTGEDAKSNKSG
jgi:putative endonuclease